MYSYNRTGHVLKVALGGYRRIGRLFGNERMAKIIYKENFNLIVVENLWELVI